MPVSSATDCPPVRRRSVRLAAGGLALLSGLGAGSAWAVPLDSFTWSSNNQTYNDFAKTCPAAGGSGCGANPTPPPATYPAPAYGYATERLRTGTISSNNGTVFSWGTISDTAYQTRLEWVNNVPGASFSLDSITLKGLGDPVGTGNNYYPSGPGQPSIGPIDKGTDASSAWEWDVDVGNTQVGQAGIQISLGNTAGYDSRDIVLYTGIVFQGYLPALYWFNLPADGNTLQTPLSFDTGALINPDTLLPWTIGVGQRIKIRLYETVWDGAPLDPGTGWPDLQYGSITVAINGAGGAAPVPATLALFGLGLVLLRPWRGRNPAGPPATR